MVRKPLTRAALLSASLLIPFLSGCSVFNTGRYSEFQCGEGGCPTPLEVYSKTNGEDANIDFGHTPPQWRTDKDADSDKVRDREAEKQRRLLMERSLDLTRLDASKMQALAQNTNIVKPVRETSQVMRIWVAPWVDNEDNLNWASYIFTEVKQSKWVYGEPSIRTQGMPPMVLPQ